MKKLTVCKLALTLGALASAMPALGATYYVNSSTGNDNSSGTTPGSAWQNLTKVDATAFQPGDSILLADGSNWYGQQLTVSSSGTAGDPITYSSYGGGADPTIWGSIPLSDNIFQPVAGSSGTYFASAASIDSAWASNSPVTNANAPVTSVFVNHQFLHNSLLVDGSAAPLTYVEGNSNSWYYDTGSAQPGLYVNTGGAISSLSPGALTATVVGGGADPYGSAVVFTNGQSNVTVENLNVKESAAAGSGYGISAGGGSNIRILNSTVSAAGVHGVAAIDTNNFLGENLSVSYMMPDLGYGASTAYVAYSDYTASNDTSQWINDSASNLNGAYPAFYTHSVPDASDPTPIASVLVKNLIASGGGMVATVSGVMAGNSQLTITGGTITDGGIVANGNTMIDGVTVTGSAAQIQLNGSNNTAQNNLVTGAQPNWEGGKNGAIVDNGIGNTIRYNTIVVDPTAGVLAPAIGLGSTSTGTQIYGNIISTPGTLFFVDSNGAATPDIQAVENLFASSGGSGSFQIVFWKLGGGSPVTMNVPASISDGNLTGNPDFADAAAGNYSLLPGSVAAYAFDPTTQQYVMQDIYGNIRPATGDSLGAIQSVPEPASSELLALGTIALAVFVGRRERFQSRCRSASGK